MDGKMKEVPEQSFYIVGNIDEVFEKAEQMKKVTPRFVMSCSIESIQTTSPVEMGSSI